MSFFKSGMLDDRMWSWIFVLTGTIMYIVFKHFGIEASVCAAVVGGGLQSYTASFKGGSTNVNNSTVKVDAIQ